MSAQPDGHEDSIDTSDPIVARILERMRRGFRAWAAEHCPEDRTPDAAIDLEVLRRDGRKIMLISEIIALARVVASMSEIDADAVSKASRLRCVIAAFGDDDLLGLLDARRDRRCRRSNNDRT